MEILDIVVNPSGGDSDDELSEQELHVADSLVPRELKLIGSAIGTERSVLFTWLKLHLRDSRAGPFVQKQAGGERTAT